MSQPVTPAVVTTHTAVATEAKSGLPQFEFGVWPGQIFWLLVTFALVYTVLARVLLPRVRGTLVSRDARIDADMAAAKDLREEAYAQHRPPHAQMAAARAAAQKTAADAKIRGQAEAAKRTAALETDLNGRLAIAESAITQARDTAMGQVRGVASDAAAAITERLTGRAVTPSELEAGLAAATPAARA